MEIVATENIKVPNSLIVSGLSNTVVDEEVFDYLKTVGSISRIVKIRDAESEFNDHLATKIVDSLLLPASNVVKPLGPRDSPRAYLDLLDSAYATVEDGDELFAKFLTTQQNAGEKPSNYLHRLQTSLNTVVKKAAIAASDADARLLKQFCIGCWNNHLISTLQLEQKKLIPPTFAELLLLLRTEEAKQAAKSTRMKQHLGLTKTKAQSNVQAACSPVDDEYQDPSLADGSSSDMDEIKKQLAVLQTQLANLTTSKGGKQKKNKKSKPKQEKSEKQSPTPPTQAVAKKPRPWYCFKCGEDGHIATGCSNVANPTLVTAKKERAQRKATGL
ncbi:paraneoplastic antigen Ma3 homolog [Lampris incognitus]|uniref:paraneoplastic antigen Ma3 homolog n=1 Tax=Lampris incognitus TaxID=2546036 RepID=UPI0024B55CEE|nr:paraneoplastic antigen Ma3 homolog [Lampris incognitus]